jgi:hypothetical protein
MFFGNNPHMASSTTTRSRGPSKNQARADHHLRSRYVLFMVSTRGTGRMSTKHCSEREIKKEKKQAT